MSMRLPDPHDVVLGTTTPPLPYPRFRLTAKGPAAPRHDLGPNRLG